MLDLRKVRFQTRSYGVDHLLKRIKEDRIENCYVPAEIDHQLMSQFVESICMDFPLPALFVERLPGNDDWRVYYGVRIMHVLKSYFIDQSFALDGLEFLPQFNGFYFKDFRRSYQDAMEDRLFPVRMVEFQPDLAKEDRELIIVRIAKGTV